MNPYLKSTTLSEEDLRAFNAPIVAARRDYHSRASCQRCGALMDPIRREKIRRTCASCKRKKT